MPLQFSFFSQQFLATIPYRSWVHPIFITAQHIPPSKNPEGCNRKGSKEHFQENILLPAIETNVAPSLLSLSHKHCLVRTTGLAGGLHWPYKGLLLAYALRHLNDSPTAHNLLAAPSRGQLNYLPLPTGSPVNGSLNSLRLIWSVVISYYIWIIGHILWLLFHFLLLYPHSTLCTRNVCFRTGTWDLRVGRISLGCFFL